MRISPLLPLALLVDVAWGGEVATAPSLATTPFLQSPIQWCANGALQVFINGNRKEGSCHGCNAVHFKNGSLEKAALATQDCHQGCILTELRSETSTSALLEQSFSCPIAQPAAFGTHNWFLTFCSVKGAQCQSTFSFVNQEKPFTVPIYSYNYYAGSCSDANFLGFALSCFSNPASCGLSNCAQDWTFADYYFAFVPPTIAAPTLPPHSDTLVAFKLNNPAGFMTEGAPAGVMQLGALPPYRALTWFSLFEPYIFNTTSQAKFTFLPDLCQFTWRLGPLTSIRVGTSEAYVPFHPKPTEPALVLAEGCAVTTGLPYSVVRLEILKKIAALNNLDSDDIVRFLSGLHVLPVPCDCAASLKPITLTIQGSQVSIADYVIPMPGAVGKCILAFVGKEYKITSVSGDADPLLAESCTLGTSLFASSIMAFDYGKRIPGVARVPRFGWGVPEDCPSTAPHEPFLALKSSIENAKIFDESDPLKGDL